MAAQQRLAKPKGIRFKMALIVGVILSALLVIDGIWLLYTQHQQAQNEAREKAVVLATEMKATWDFVDINQQSLNRNPDGTFRTKNLVCVVSSKAVSELFTENSDYVIRFVKENPRQVSALPDAFEQAAFDAFEADPTLRAYYGLDTDEAGNQVFRYVQPLHATASCLECHGTPVGDLDQFGYAKEGWELGQVAGAMSITEPMDIYESAVRQTVLNQLLFMALILILASVSIYLVMSHLVLNPINAIGAAVRQIDEGDFNYALPASTMQGTDEISQFARDFDTMAHQLEELYSNLEGQVEKRTEEAQVLNDILMIQKSELKTAYDKLSEESAYKNEFFAIVSHELRTPLTSILAFARMLKDNETLDDKARAGLKEIEDNGTLLLNLVNNILTISKAEAGRMDMTLEPVDFVDLISLVKKTLDPLAANKDITLTARAEPDVPVSMADWEKLRRIIDNLGDNAIKYTHRGGMVDIHVHFDPALFDAGAIVCNVADDGMGILPEDMELIFNLYEQAGKMSANRRYRGTGLGLAVVKQLTAMHGGTVSVASEYKKGSTFTICIPYVAVPEDEDDDENLAD